MAQIGTYCGTILGMKTFACNTYDLIEAVTEEMLDASNLKAFLPTSMLYQAGTLTLTDDRNGFYTLGIPNKDIRRDLNAFVVEPETSEKLNVNLNPLTFNPEKFDFAVEQLIA